MKATPAPGLAILAIWLVINSLWALADWMQGRRIPDQPQIYVRPRVFVFDVSELRWVPGYTANAAHYERASVMQNVHDISKYEKYPVFSPPPKHANIIDAPAEGIHRPGPNQLYGIWLWDIVSFWWLCSIIQRWCLSKETLSDLTSPSLSSASSTASSPFSEKSRSEPRQIQVGIIAEATVGEVIFASLLVVLLFAFLRRRERRRRQMVVRQDKAVQL